MADAHLQLHAIDPTPIVAPLVLCHGDLHPGNLLVDDHGDLFAVLDWTVATLAERVLDYEALRCAMEVSNAAAWRLAVAEGRSPDLLRPTWDSIGDVMLEYLRARTGVEIELPPVVRP